MANESPNTSVTVMSAEQMAQLISSIVSALNSIETKIETMANRIEAIAGKLEADITPSALNLEYGSQTGVKSIAYILASNSVSTLKRAYENNTDTDEETENGESDQGEESAESTTVIENVRSLALSNFEELSTYEFDITEDERISFKTQESFESSRKGLAFDYTRLYYNNTNNVVENTKTDEYALLVFDSHVKTSGKTGSTDINRMKTWIDYKQIQTVVIITNTISNKCIVYFPTQEKFNELDPETYKSEKEAMDSIVIKYQDMIGDKYKGIAFVPVSSIEQGITLEEYRIAAKNITPSCEYM